MLIAGRLVIHFLDDLVLKKGPIPSGEGVFFDQNRYVHCAWIEKWGGSFILLRPHCSVWISGNYVVIKRGGDEVRIPHQSLIEVYEKETGKKIWPVTANANP